MNDSMNRHEGMAPRHERNSGTTNSLSRIRFGIRHLLVLLTLACLLLGVRANHAWRQQKAVEAIVNFGGRVYYGTEVGLGLEERRWQDVVGVRIKCADLSPLRSLTKIRTLTVERNARDLSPLRLLTDMEVIELWGAQVDDMSALRGLTKLHTLTIRDAQIRDLRPLVRLKRLCNLDLRGNPVHDIGSVDALSQLEHLDLTGTCISDLSPLASLTCLKALILEDNPLVSDLSPLENLASLEIVRLRNCSVNDISALAKLQNLKDLVLISTNVEDLSPVQNLPYLDYINVLGSPASRALIHELFPACYCVPPNAPPQMDGYTEK